MMTARKQTKLISYERVSGFETSDRLVKMRFGQVTMIKIVVIPMKKISLTITIEAIHGDVNDPDIADRWVGFRVAEGGGLLNR